MYRTAARRLLPALRRRTVQSPSSTSHVPLPVRIMNPTSFSTAAGSENFQNQNPNHFDSSDSSSHEARNTRTTEWPKAHWQQEQARVLQASLRYVIRLGWTESAMIEGAREVGISPSIVGSFPRKEAALVEFFMDECLQKLIDMEKDLKNLIPSQRVAKLVRIRLEMQAPYISKWPRALSAYSFKQRAMLVDEIWHAAGDEATDYDWCMKRTVLGVIYSTTELYMLTDASPDFQDTWEFLDRRIKDAFDLKKAVQEAKYLAEAASTSFHEESTSRFLNMLKNGRRTFAARNHLFLVA